MLKRTYFITFPRSGNHWLERVMARYFGADWRFCDAHADPERRMSLCPDTNAEKNHDFNLDLAPAPEFGVIVQMRRDIGAAMRSWRLFNEPAMPLADFTQMHQYYWLAFLAKWCRGNYPVIAYEDLLSNPIKTFDRAARLLSGAETDIPALIRAIEPDVAWDKLGAVEVAAPVSVEVSI